MIGAVLSVLAGGWSRATAAAALGIALLLGVAGIRRGGAQAQRLADMERRERDRAKANQAAADVAGMADRVVLAELRRDFSRPPDVRVGKDHSGVP